MIDTIAGNDIIDMEKERFWNIINYSYMRYKEKLYSEIKKRMDNMGRKNGS